MEQIIALFQSKQRALFLVGAVVRNQLMTHDWGKPGTIEWIALASKQEVAEWSELPIVEIPPDGPIQIQFQIERQSYYGYIYCAPSNNEPMQTLHHELQKRGFSIDALAFDPRGSLIDPFGGKADLEDGILSPTQNIDELFSSDALNLIKYSRLQAERKLQTNEKLHQAAHKHAGKVLYAPRNGWFREMTDLLCGTFVHDGMQALYDTRVLGMLLPEVHGMVGFAETSLHHHKNLWTHTLQVIAQAVPSPLVRWAALLHDVGKIWTRTYANKNAVHFFQHEELGAILVEGIGTRFQLTPTLTEQIAFLVRNHLRPNAYQSNWTDAAVRRLMREADQLLEPLLMLSQADFTSSQPKRIQEVQRLTKELQTRVAELRKEETKRPLLPKGIGQLIMEECAVSQGPHIGRIKQYLLRSINDKNLIPYQTSEYYIEHLKSMGSLPK